MAGGSELVRLDIADGVARLTLDRAEQHNSLVPEPLDDLLRHLAAVRDADVRRGMARFLDVRAAG